MTTTLLLLSALAVSQLTETDAAIRAEDLATHIGVLASDAFEGRGPGTAGEVKTVGYLIERLRAYGLEPAGDVVEGQTQWTQSVPMVELTPKGAPVVTLASAGGDIPFVFGRDVMIWSPEKDRAAVLDGSDMVFAGYGIVAPEYDWNDYEYVDVRGKTVVVLVNDPGYASGDPNLFRGNAMTYYGRWTYKFEEAARQGAAACLIVHEDGAAGYGWPVVLQSWGRPQLQLESSAGEARTRIQGWITEDAARRLFESADLSFEALVAAAHSTRAKSVPLHTKLSALIENTVRRIESSNVVAKVVGRSRPGEAVLVCAHWDHLGRREGAASEDNIFNGASDNATGVAALLELAEAVASQEVPPERTVLFVAMTAEEKGLLGSAHYAAAPLFPLASTVCGLNIDGVNTLGPMKDMVVVGEGASELDHDLRAVLAAQGRRLVPEATPERGAYFRSDHFSLAKVGVPMLFTGKGTVSVEHGADWVTAQNNEFLRKRYHRVADEFDSTWDMRGALEDVKVFHGLVTLWANMPGGRSWSPDSEFRGARERSLGGVRRAR